MTNEKWGMILYVIRKLKVWVVSGYLKRSGACTHTFHDNSTISTIVSCHAKVTLAHDLSSLLYNGWRCTQARFFKQFRR